MNYLEKIVRGLELASPYVFAARYEDFAERPIEAALAGAAALRKRKLDAKVAPCAIVGVNEAGTRRLAVGLSPREIYARLERDHAATNDDAAASALEPFDAWHAKFAPGLAADDPQFHAVVTVSFGGEHATLDLGLGQVRRLTGANIPICLSMLAPQREWPRVEIDGWTLEYVPSPRSEAILPTLRAYDDPALVNDVNVLIDLAIACGFDRDVFAAELGQRFPAYERASNRV